MPWRLLERCVARTPDYPRTWVRAIRLPEDEVSSCLGAPGTISRDRRWTCTTPAHRRGPTRSRGSGHGCRWGLATLRTRYRSHTRVVARALHENSGPSKARRIGAVTESPALARHHTRTLHPARLCARADGRPVGSVGVFPLPRACASVNGEADSGIAARWARCGARRTRSAPKRVDALRAGHRRPPGNGCASAAG